jgi:hypothetical protein
LEVSVYAEGGRKGVLWLPDCRFGRGWHHFAGELRLMVVPPGVTNGLEQTGSLSLLMSAWIDDSAGSSKERSFREVLQSKPRFEMKGRSSLCMDILQVSSKDAVGTGGDDLQLVVDCFDLEYSGVAAGPAKMGPSSVKRRVEKLLGFFQLELGRVFVGLLEGLSEGFDGLSFRKQVRVVLKGFGLGLSYSPKPTGRLQCLRRPSCKMQLGFKPFRSGRLKPPTIASSSIAVVVKLLSSQVSEACWVCLCFRSLSLLLRCAFVGLPLMGPLWWPL